MNFLHSCGSLFEGFSLVQDDDEDEDEDPWRSIQTHKGEVVPCHPEDALEIDPLDYDAVQQIQDDPPITVIPSFLDDHEIEHVLGLCSGRWKHSRVGTVNAGFKKSSVHESRTSMSCTLRRGETPIVKELERRVSELAGIDVAFLENLAPVRYEPGQQYRPHHDGSARPVTIFIYLNDLDEGAEGETFFPVLNIKVIPRKGCAIMWPNPIDIYGGNSKDNEDSRLLHAGLPPLSGVKYGLNCFFNIESQEKKSATSSWTAEPDPVAMPTASAPSASSFAASSAVTQKPVGQQAPSWAPSPWSSPLPSRFGPGWGAANPPLHAPRSGAWPGIVACN